MTKTLIAVLFFVGFLLAITFNSVIKLNRDCTTKGGKLIYLQYQGYLCVKKDYFVGEK